MSDTRDPGAAGRYAELEDRQAREAKATSTVLGAIAATDEAVREALEHLHRSHESDDGLDPIEIDEDGFMHGKGITVIKSKRKGKLAKGLEHVVGYGWHYTDTRNAGAVNLAKRIVEYTADDDHSDERSCHAWIDRAGLIAQSVSFEAASWHMGSPTAKRFKVNEHGDIVETVNGYGMNSLIAGIELENVGELRRIEADAKVHTLKPMGEWVETANGKDWCYVGWPFAFNTKHGRPTVVPLAEVQRVTMAGRETYWHAFTEAQCRAAWRVSAALAATYRIPRTNAAFQHSAVDPSRRTDAGPAWVGPNAHKKFKDPDAGSPLDLILDAVY